VRNNTLIRALGRLLERENAEKHQTGSLDLPVQKPVEKQ
jgi:hypothetical protein